MSRKRPAPTGRTKDARRESRAGAAKSAARRGAPPWRALVAVALLAIAAFAAWRVFGGRAAGERHAASAVPPDRAHATGAKLLDREQVLEALPWLRRGVEGSGTTSWGAHYVLGKACATATLKTTSRAGIEQPMLRSSVERVALARECVREFGLAATLAPPGAERAFVLSEWAEFEFAWGRMFEAFALFRRAQSETPNDAALAQRADAFQYMLEHPEAFETTEEVMRRERGR